MLPILGDIQWLSLARPEREKTTVSLYVLTGIVLSFPVYTGSYEQPSFNKSAVDMIKCLYSSFVSASIVSVWWIIPVFFLPASAERFIVEVTRSTSLSNITRSLPEDPPKCLLGALPSIGMLYDSSPLFTGFSIHLASDGQQQSHYAVQKKCLEALYGVIRVWSSQTYTLASSTEPAIDQDTKPDAHRKFNSSIFHERTGVNKLHSQGLTGRGVVVAVLDTGIDYLHPGLGGGFGPEHRVRFGYDFVGDGYLNGGEPVEGPDPYTDCHYHGTHVSGIIGGNHEEVGFAGVAPDVTLEMYRCTGCTNQPINSEVVIKAALMAHSRGVDVISASFILEEGAYADDPMTEVISRIAEEGRTVVVLAAGNWGWAGTFSVAAPAAARGILVVGAVNAQQVHDYAARATFSTVSDGGSGVEPSVHDEEFAWRPAPPSRFPDSIVLRAVSLNSSVEDDCCNTASLPSPRPDFRGAVVLVRRGGCTFADKMKTIKARGAEYALVYDNTPDSDSDEPWSLVDADNTFDMRGVGFISASTGERLVDLLRSGHKISMKMDSNFTLTPYISAPLPNTFPPGQLAPRSTWGPDGELGLVPSLLAPGIGVMSTFPRSWGGYKVLSGTSMSAPYVAGCAALVRQAHPEIRAADIVSRLMSTSRPVRFHDGSDEGDYSFLAPTYKQGAGLIDCFAAATTTTEVSPSHMVFGDAEFMKPEQEVHITNSGEQEAVYRISHVPAASVDSLSEDRGRIVPMTLAYTDNVASKEFLETLRPEEHVQLRMDLPESQKIHLAPGTEAAIRLSFDASGLVPDRCPLYGGFVDIQEIRGEVGTGDVVSATGAHLSIPYAGVACRLRDVPVLQPQSVNPVNYTFLTSATAQEPLGGPYAAEPIRPFHLFILPGPGHPDCEDDTNECAGDKEPPEEVHFPTISLSIAMQSRAVSVHLISLPPNHKEGAQEVHPHHPQQGGYDLLAAPAPVVDYRRHGQEYQAWPAFSAAVTTDHPGGFSRIWTKYLAFRGQLADGAWAPAGAYLFRVCGVRAWDDPRDASAFGDCVTTDPFVLRYDDASRPGSSELGPGSDRSWLLDLGSLGSGYYAAATVLKVAFMVMVVTALYAFFGRGRRQPWYIQVAP